MNISSESLIHILNFDNLSPRGLVSHLYSILDKLTVIDVIIFLVNEHTKVNPKNFGRFHYIIALFVKLFEKQ